MSGLFFLWLLVYFLACSVKGSSELREQREQLGLSDVELAINGGPTPKALVLAIPFLP